MGGLDYAQRYKQKNTTIKRVKKMEKCPSCGHDLSFQGKSRKFKANGHHARLFKCKNKNCGRDEVLGGWCNV